jgi:AraC-like DNA-binding protein
VFSDFYHIASVIAVFLGLVIFTRKEKSVKDYLLATWLMILGVNVFLFHRYFDHKESQELLLLINYVLVVLQMPAAYLYVMSFYKSKRYLLKLIGFTIGIPLIIVIISLLAFGIDAFNPSLLFSGSFFIRLLLYAYLICGFPLFLIFALKGIQHYKQIRLQQVSEISNNDFVIIKRFIFGLLIAFICLIVLLALSFFIDFVTIESAFGSAIVILSLSVLYAGVFGLQNSELFTEHFEKKAVILKPNQFSESDLLKTLYELDRCMDEKKPYLHPRLSLKALSEIVLIPENQISAAINTIRKQNFYDYINTLRVNAFIERCKTADRYNYTLTAIAFECGFNSKSTFYDIFKRQTGSTPASYLKSMK